MNDVAGLTLPPPERARVGVPTLLLWALDDTALLPGLLDGLEQYVPRLTIHRMPGATHWVVHEQPKQVALLIGRWLNAA